MVGQATSRVDRRQQNAAISLPRVISWICVVSVRCFLVMTYGFCFAADAQGTQLA
ncbi:MAG: hypothetical protein RLY14_1858 [Planctomycetota bacterium]|jgi:hypothetical protein